MERVQEKSAKSAVAGESGSRKASSASKGPQNPPIPEGLEGFGEPVTVHGNRPFLLDDPAMAYVVETGRVELFAVGVEEGQPVGQRSHYFTAQPGQAFFGMDLEAYGVGAGLLAVGHLGTVVRRITVVRLSQLARDEDLGPRVALWLDRWISGLSKSLTQDIVPGPMVDASLAPEEEISLDPGQKARAVREVVWLDVERGDLLYVGMEPLSFTGRDLFPLATTTWVEASNEFGVRTDLVARSTPSLLEGIALWRGLNFFHRVLCQCEFINKKLALVDELNRLRSRQEQAQLARQAALRSLAGVLDRKIAARELLLEDFEGDLVLQTMRQVGDAAGIPVLDHEDAPEEQAFEERVGAIAKASGARLRGVALRDDWWRRDQGPILGRWETNKAPVALLPSGPRSYELVDLAARQRTAVDEAVAERISPFGHVLYRPFDEGPQAVRSLLRFGLRGLGWDAAMLVLMGLLLGVLAALTPIFTGKVFDAAIPEAEKNLLVQFAFALGVAAVASAAFKITQSIAVLRIEGKMDYSIQAAVWDRLLNLPSTFFRQYSAGDLADRAAGINAIRRLVASAGVSAALGAMSSVFYVLLLFWYSARLAGTALGLTVALLAFTFLAGLLQLRYQRQEFEQRGKLTGLVLQLITGVSRLRVSGAEDHAFRVWAQKFAEQRRLSFVVGRIQNALTVVSSGFPVISNLAIFGVLASMMIEASARGLPSPLSTGEFIAFSASYGLFLAAMQSLTEAALNLVRAVPIYERLEPILVAEAEIDESKAYPGQLAGEIELSHVHFRYQEDGPWIIRDISLTIQPGEFVAFVGASGSGKSTLMRLMLGFETPEKGSIYYDGQDLKGLDLREVRQQLGVVLQESRVLPADIYRNIIGTSTRGVDEAWEAARMAGLERDIKEMPMGLHTYVSEGGGGLSGGQRQRLLIARALVNRPRIIFMDEATSALDNATQNIVTESLGRLHASRVVIAHRLSTIIHADRICYLEGGVIRESGTYEELMREDGKFAELAKRQLA
ncbi:MAG: NHLP bacteriocin export ABC transporter permease/ATPase subunit [Deltaproteobacteria bacterium]|nr:NHLP bacteriocin export ABC transporter permease/ATPase subunit [Deltaproteobacteria bacterium]